MSWNLDKLPSFDVIEKTAVSVIALVSTVAGAWVLHYGKWKEKVRLAKIGPVAPMPIPQALPPPLPKIPTLSPGIAARVAELEREREEARKERKSVEETIQREREKWELEEQIRRLKKELNERSDELDKSAREITRLRFENRALVEDLESRDQKIARLKRRLLDSDAPGKKNDPKET